MSTEKVQNSLRKIRKQKGLSQEALGAAMDYDFRTISQYENSDRALPLEFLRKAAAALGVSEEDIQSEPPTYSEDAPPYRTRSIPVELLSDQLLWTLKNYFSQRIPEAQGREMGMILSALSEVGAEMDRRGYKSPREVSSNLTAEEESLATGVIDQAERERQIERESGTGAGAGKTPPSATGGLGAHKRQPSSPSSPPSKAGHPVTGGKAQK